MLDNVYIREKTLDDAWLRLYNILNGLDDKSESRDGDIRGEIINANIVIDDEYTPAVYVSSGDTVVSLSFEDLNMNISSIRRRIANAIKTTV